MRGSSSYCAPLSSGPPPPPLPGLRRSAYEAMAYGNVVTLPSVDTVRRHAELTQAESGHSKTLLSSVAKAAAGLTRKQREVALIFDEVSLVGELAFKVVRGEYRFVGMVDSRHSFTLFGERPATRDEKAALKSAVATHALVFQISELGELTCPRFRRVVGIHAVNSLTADRLFTLFRETVENLQEVCGLQVSCDQC